jgi:hypothetical protein
LEILKRTSSSNEDIVDYLDLLEQDDEGLDVDDVTFDMVKYPKIREFTEKLISRLEQQSDSGANHHKSSSWFGLTEAEKGEFIALVNEYGRVFDQLVTEWRPWWHRRDWQRPVISIGDEDEELEAVIRRSHEAEEDDDDDDDETCLYPQVYTNFERFSKLTSVIGRIWYLWIEY